MSYVRSCRESTFDLRSIRFVADNVVLWPIDTAIYEVVDDQVTSDSVGDSEPSEADQTPTAVDVDDALPVAFPKYPSAFASPCERLQLRYFACNTSGFLSSKQHSQEANKPIFVEPRQMFQKQVLDLLKPGDVSGTQD